MAGSGKDRRAVSVRAIWRAMRGYLVVLMSIVIFLALLAFITIAIRFLQVI